MYRGAGPPHWILIQIQKLQKSCGRPGVRMDRHIILPLREFYPMAWIRMRCAQLQAARMISKNRCGRLDIDTQRKIDINTDRNIRSTRPHWGHLDPSVGINYYRRDYTAENVACGRISCMKLRVARMITKMQRRQPDRQRYIEKERQTGI